MFHQLQKTILRFKLFCLPQYPRPIRIRLDANESFLMPTVDDRELMAGAAADTALNRYPDPLAEEVCRAFAGLYDIRRELVTAGNGSDELISLILSTFLQKGEKVLWSVEVPFPVCWQWEL